MLDAAVSLDTTMPAAHAVYPIASGSASTCHSPQATGVHQEQYLCFQLLLLLKHEQSGEEAAFNAEAWHFPMEMRAWFSEDMEDDLHTAGVTNELVTSWARKEARAWNESHMPEQRNCLRSHRKAILEFMEALARVTGLSVPGWQVAILLWDAFCRTGIFASKSDLEALKELPAAVAALVLLLRKDECSCTAPRAAELAHFTTRFYRRFFARSTSATEDTNGEGPQEPVPSVMAEQIHQQERQLLEALDWQMHRPCAATWIDTLCKRLNIITSKKFTHDFSQPSPDTLRTGDRCKSQAKWNRERNAAKPPQFPAGKSRPHIDTDAMDYEDEVDATKESALTELKAEALAGNGVMDKNIRKQMMAALEEQTAQSSAPRTPARRKPPAPAMTPPAASKPAAGVATSTGGAEACYGGRWQGQRSVFYGRCASVAHVGIATQEKPLAQEVETKRYLAMLKEQGVEGSPQEIDSAESEDEDLVISELKAGGFFGMSASDNEVAELLGHDREDGDDQEELDAGVELLLILKKAVKDLVLLVQMAVLLLRTSDMAKTFVGGCSYWTSRGGKTSRNEWRTGGGSQVQPNTATCAGQIWNYGLPGNKHRGSSWLKRLVGTALGPVSTTPEFLGRSSMKGWPDLCNSFPLIRNICTGLMRKGPEQTTCLAGCVHRGCGDGLPLGPPACSVDGMDNEWLDHAMATSPQLSEAYGNIMILPNWILMSGRFAPLIDGQPIGRRISTAYCAGEAQGMRTKTQITWTSNSAFSNTNIGGFDANGPSPSDYEEVTAALKYGEADAAGNKRGDAWRMRTMVAELRSYTLGRVRHSDMQMGNYIESVLLPLVGRLGRQLRSYVAEDIDVGAVRDDRFAVGLVMTGQKASVGKGAGRCLLPVEAPCDWIKKAIYSGKAKPNAKSVEEEKEFEEYGCTMSAPDSQQQTDVAKKFSTSLMWRLDRVYPQDLHIVKAKNSDLPEVHAADWPRRTRHGVVEDATERGALVVQIPMNVNNLAIWPEMQTEFFRIPRKVFIDDQSWHRPFVDARTEAEDADLSLTEFLRDRDAVLWDPLILAMLDPCKCSFLLGSNWEASEVEPSGAWNAEAAFDDPMCFISGKVDELWQQVQWVCQQSVATSQALVHLMPSSFEMQPKQMANGLICLMCVIARILPLEVLRSTKVSSSEWQKLFCDALSSGEKKRSE
ncbi:hypothetical protein AK812_SmicGene13581 [Symbiodinium microadriaticum]|uniref:Uncharacterized protein n=1 Tax=Symbiodinium microadriaticum TaxID=2951 RepID=A0A1Q9E7S3_SYMMI|nr:hypothetical protein AK812_SmicGene13581 [Symbiodinium microadriaticum]